MLRAGVTGGTGLPWTIRKIGRVYTGYTDADPSDGPGYGRGRVRRRQVSDSDPVDPPGRGRGW
jgi:hypothetical protein